MLKSNCFVDPLSTPFSRRGSYLAFANRNEGESQFGKNTLYLSTAKGGGSGMSNLNSQNSCRQISMEIIWEGKRLPTVISTTPSEVILESDKGSVRFCLAEQNLMMGRSESGLSLRLTTPRGVFGGAPLELPDGTWRFSFSDDNGLLIVFRGKAIANPGGGFMIMPDAEGVFEFGIEEYAVDPGGRPKDSYPSYASAVAAVDKEFDEFCAGLYPELPAEFEPMRRQALWTTWSLMVDPDGVSTYQHTMVKMMRIIFESAFGWQQAMQAIFLSKNTRLAWNILQSCFDHQDCNGRIADAISHKSGLGTSMKPPFQGVALNWLMDHCDLSEIPLEDKKYVYERMAKWTEFFFNFRDLDKDGVWENQGAIETGWEDAAYFYAGFPLASPDMNAYTVLMMDALARLGKSIGVPGVECEAWTKRADELTQKIIDKFWNGERWIVVNTRTGAVGDSLSLPIFGALILGKRLPQDILEKTVDFIWKNGFITPFGFASESPESPYFNHGFTAGSVIVPAQLIFCLALEAAGKPELAKEMGLRYARTLRDNGMFHIHNALTGAGERGLVAFGEKQLFWSSWASSCYLFFADRYGK
ncbi:MAG: hypothetical protein IKP17_09255 [Oscillospiraceae bacterium]|nr:hypothetical protein [Oscillospiraceae bacterium]